MIPQIQGREKRPAKQKSGRPKPTAHLYEPPAHPIPLLRMEQRSGTLPGPDPPIGDQAGDEGNHNHAGAAVDHRGKGARDFCQKSNHGNRGIQGKDDGEDHCRIPPFVSVPFPSGQAQAPVGPALGFP